LILEAKKHDEVHASKIAKMPLDVFKRLSKVMKEVGARTKVNDTEDALQHVLDGAERAKKLTGSDAGLLRKIIRGSDSVGTVTTLATAASLVGFAEDVNAGKIHLARNPLEWSDKDWKGVSTLIKAAGSAEGVTKQMLFFFGERLDKASTLGKSLHAIKVLGPIGDGIAVVLDLRKMEAAYEAGDPLRTGTCAAKAWGGTLCVIGGVLQLPGATAPIGAVFLLAGTIVVVGAEVVEIFGIDDEKKFLDDLNVLDKGYMAEQERLRQVRDDARRQEREHFRKVTGEGYFQHKQ
jgi:hypothetical protein